VWLGDSLAAGVGSSTDDGSVARQVTRRLDVPIQLEVLAASGATVADVIDRQLPRLQGTPDVVVVSVGANDATHLTSTDDFEARYDVLLGRLPSATRIVLLGVPDIGSAPRLAQPLRWLAGFRGGQLDRIVQRRAAAHGAHYIDIAATTGPAFRADPDRYFAADGYHPNDAGYAVWTDAIAPVLAGLMSSPR
jgi:lysophospholipase L1-like esterase